MRFKLECGNIFVIIPHLWGARQQKNPHPCGYGFLSFLLQVEALVETVNTSTGVNQLLLAGIERVALGADLNADLLLSRTGSKDVATGATDGGLLVVRMDAFFHVVHLFLLS